MSVQSIIHLRFGNALNVFGIGIPSISPNVENDKRNSNSLFRNNIHVINIFVTVAGEIPKTLPSIITLGFLRSLARVNIN